MRKMTYAEGIREGMNVKMRENPDVFLFGEDVGKFGGCFGVSAGMFDEFGEMRVRDPPISKGCNNRSSSRFSRMWSETYSRINVCGLCYCRHGSISKPGS